MALTALACGNNIVFKPAEQISLPAVYMCSLVKEVCNDLPYRESEIYVVKPIGIAFLLLSLSDEKFLYVGSEMFRNLYLGLYQCFHRSLKV